MAYRSSGETKDIAIDPEELLAAQRRSTKKRLVAVALALVLVGGVATGGIFYTQSVAKADKQRAWDTLATCLVGGPLVAGAKPSVVVRHTQLVVMSVPPDRRTSPGEPVWPARCSAAAHGVGEVIRKAGGESPLVDSTEKLAKAIALDTGASVDLAELVDKIFADAAADGLATRRAPGVTEPPAPATPMTLDTLPASAKLFGGGNALALSSVRAAPFGDSTLHLLVDDKDFALGPVLCSLAQGKTELACKKVPAPASQLSPGLRLWGTNSDGVAPYVFAGERGKTGIFKSDTGAQVVHKLEYGAYGAAALRDGSLGYLVWNEKPAETHFVRIATDGVKTETKLVLRAESGNPYYSTSVFWDVVAYKLAKKDVDGIRLMVRPIEASGALGPPVDVGRIDEIGHIEGGADEEPHLTACRTKDTTVVRAKGWQNTFVSFFLAGRWTAPVESKGLRGQLQCSAGEAIISRVWGGPISGHFKGGIVQSRCTVSGCTEHTIDINKMTGDANDVLPRAQKDVRAVDLDGKLLVVWNAGDRGGLRMRLAPADQIASASDTIVFEDHLRDGSYRVESTLVDFQLLPAPGGALLLLGTVDGVYAHLIDASGKLTPLATRF